MRDATAPFTTVIQADNATPKTTVVTSPKLGTGMANPLLDFQFCADPTAVEYNGRLYVYGTNDHQQYDEGAESNTYERIKKIAR